MLKYSDFPGSSNGTGLFQTLVGLKIRDLYEQMVRAQRSNSPLALTPRSACRPATWSPPKRSAALAGNRERVAVAVIGVDLACVPAAWQQHAP